VCGVGRGSLLRSNIPRSALCATLDTYNFYLFILKKSKFFKIFGHPFSKNHISVSVLTTPSHFWLMTAKDLNFQLDILKHFSFFSVFHFFIGDYF
jgi:hypothetical protein